MSVFLKRVFLLSLIFSTAALQYMDACTSAVISGRVTPDGRPLLWKHRDTGELDNRLQHFHGERFSFVSLVNSYNEDDGSWIGSNTAGFAIMNTASYNIKDDDIPYSEMDKEGILMHRALGICSSVADFETYLDTLARPLGVEANFGVIDAYGGAAYYEVNNFSWEKYDVNDPDIAGNGYIVMTNFSFSGRKDDYKGYERYLTAAAVFKEAAECNTAFTPQFIFDYLSRSYRHEFLGVDYSAGYSRMKESVFPNGIIVDQDFIPRRSTSASVVVQGIAPGNQEQIPVMWTVLGYPVCAPAIPVPVTGTDHIPYFLKRSSDNMTAMMCDVAMHIKNCYIFRFSTSSGNMYMDIESVLSGRDGRPSLMSLSKETDAEIRCLYISLQNRFSGRYVRGRKYLEEYDSMVSVFWELYLEKFKPYTL